MKTRIEVTMPLCGKVTSATIAANGRRRIMGDPDNFVHPLNLKHLAKSYSLDMPQPTSEEIAAGHSHKYSHRIMGGELEKGEAVVEYSTSCCNKMRTWLTNLKPRIDADSVATKRTEAAKNANSPAFVAPESVTDLRE